MMTIKELADDLGCSKTAIRKYMDEEFRANYTETDRKGVITINDDGCKLIAETMGIERKETETNANPIPETGENAGNIIIPAAVWALLEEQLRQKDEQLKAKDAQLEAKDQQIADLTATVRAQADSLQAAQALHAGTMQQMLPETLEPAVVAEDSVEDGAPIEPARKWKLFDWFRGK